MARPPVSSIATANDGPAPVGVGGKSDDATCEICGRPRRKRLYSDAGNGPIPVCAYHARVIDSLRGRPGARPVEQHAYALIERADRADRAGVRSLDQFGGGGDDDRSDDA